MNNQLWNYIITAVGLLGFFLAGRKVWWCWYVNIANQVLWFIYGFATHQWGFVVGTFAYTFVFVKNAISWTEEHKKEQKLTAGSLKGLSMDDALTPEEKKRPFGIQEPGDKYPIKKEQDSAGD